MYRNQNWPQRSSPCTVTRIRHSHKSYLAAEPEDGMQTKLWHWVTDKMRVNKYFLKYIFLNIFLKSGHSVANNCQFRSIKETKDSESPAAVKVRTVHTLHKSHIPGLPLTLISNAKSLKHAHYSHSVDYYSQDCSIFVNAKISLHTYYQIFFFVFLV